MNLHDSMQQAVDDVDIDLDRLARVSRAQGTRLIRRRNGVALVGAAATALGAFVIGTAALETGSPSSAPSTGQAAERSESLDLADTGRITGRGAAAGLRFAVSQLEDGTAIKFSGQDPNPGDDNVGASGRFEWLEPNAPGISIVGINVQTGPDVADYVPQCTPLFGGVPQEPLDHCHTEQFADGSRVMTYAEHQQVSDGVGIRRTAELMRPDGTLITAFSTNGYELVKEYDWDITRPAPGLTFNQLTDIVSQPWWGAQLPADLLAQGRDLDGYNAITPFGAGD